MSLSKQAKHYRRCASFVLSERKESVAFTRSLNCPKMLSNSTKTLVLNQWKTLTNLKNYISKLDKGKLLNNALNKELAHFLQRIQPSVYGSDLIRYFDSQVVPSSKQMESEKTEGKTLSFPSVFSGLKLKLANKEKVEEKEVTPKWKARQLVPKEAIAENTLRILSALTIANTETTTLQALNELCDHIKTFPEAKHGAVKHGSIRMLLKIRSVSIDNEVQSAVNEGLALLGYADRVPGKGIRILSIDGGGIRGILVIEMLRKLEEFSGKRIDELFDLICGVSTGAIIASLLSVKSKTLDEIADIYTNLSTQIFTQSAFKGTSNLVWSHSYYDTALWEKLLQNELGDMTLIGSRRNIKSLKMCAISTVVNRSHLTPYVFRNYNLPCRVQSPSLGGSHHMVWQAVRASAAAPTYFEEFKLGSMLHQDGGVLINNPTSMAIHEAKLIWPTTPLQCVISFGTGRTAPNPIENSVESEISVANSSWTHKLLAIIESATDTEGVHTMLNDLLPDNIYYRFNPYLTEMVSMAEINVSKIEQLKRDTIMYLRRNEDKFKEAAKNLVVTKSAPQKFLDWVNLQCEVNGVLHSKY